MKTVMETWHVRSPCGERGEGEDKGLTPRLDSKSHSLFMLQDGVYLGSRTDERTSKTCDGTLIFRNTFISILEFLW